MHRLEHCGRIETWAEQREQARAHHARPAAAAPAVDVGGLVRVRVRVRVRLRVRVRVRVRVRLRG